MAPSTKTPWDIIDEQDERKARTVEFVLWPEKWLGCTLPATYNWTIQRLSVSEREKIPSKPGIYTLLVQPGIVAHPACSFVIYVGQAVSLRRRFSEYLNRERKATGRPKILRLLHIYEDYLYFCYITISRGELDVTEDALIEAYDPPCNDQVPATLRAARGAF